MASFSAAPGAVTDPVHSAFGWHVLKVERVEPATTRTLDQVRDQLRRDVAHDRAQDIAYERANRVEDALDLWVGAVLLVPFAALLVRRLRSLTDKQRIDMVITAVCVVLIVLSGAF